MTFETGDDIGMSGVARTIKTDWLKDGKEAIKNGIVYISSILTVRESH